MSYRKPNGDVVIEDEPEGICESCGKKRELRPYGPNGQNICVPCGMKDPRATFRNMAMKLGGDTPEQAEELVQFMFGPEVK